MKEHSNMATSVIAVENRTSKEMQFQIEPECTLFEVPCGKTFEITGTYQNEPITIQFSDHGGEIFGAIFPGDGDVIIRMEGMEIT